MFFTSIISGWSPDSYKKFLLFILVVFSFPSPSSFALVPEEILVIANGNLPESIRTARYYMQKRGISEDRLLRLDTPDREACRYEEYRDRIADPVKARLIAQRKKRNKKRIRCLVTIYGIPLKITGGERTVSEITRIRNLQKKKQEMERDGKKADPKEKKEWDRKIRAIQSSLYRLEMDSDRGAAVDSELSLVSIDKYSRAGRIDNPYYPGNARRKDLPGKGDVIMVSRIDGPDEKTCRRIIDDSLEAEKKGLSGIAYIDARWKEKRNGRPSAYGLYDASLHKTAHLIRKEKIMPVRLEDTGALFSPGSCPDAALYCGWYSLARYVDAFSWQKGAVGYHIASSECRTLKNPDTTWCRMMLEKGAAATIGPVGEPYVDSFPVPAIFFDLLVEGRFSLAECYLVSTPHLSWKMVLVGDPLYRPFVFRDKKSAVHP